MIRRVLYLLLATVILGGLAAAIAFWAFDFKPKMLAKAILGAPPPAQTISAEPARSEEWPQEIKTIGTLSASEGINVASQVGGIVQSLNFDSGQMIKQGQVLAVLNSDTEQADLRSLQPQLDNANTELARKKLLIDKGLSPRNDLDAMQMQVLTLQANIDRIKAVIAQKTISAPWDGQVGLRQVSVGSFVAPGQAMVWLQKIDPIYADFTVTEQQFAQIKPGQQVTAKFNGFPDQSFTGQIVTSDARISDQSRTITVRAKLDNPQDKLLPGMYADIMITTNASTKFIAVPMASVTYSLYGDSVYVAVPAKADPASNSTTPTAAPAAASTPSSPTYEIEQRFIKVGPQREGRVAILSGVNEGEEIVTGGQNKIKPGTKVFINNSIPLKKPDSTQLQ